MKISQDVKISIELIDILKKDLTGKPINVDVLASKIGTTKFFLHKSVRLLAKNNLVTVVRGPGGGLLDSGKEISLLEIMTVLNHVKKSDSTGDRSQKIEKDLLDYLSKVQI